MQKQSVSKTAETLPTVRRQEPTVRDLMTPNPYTLAPRDTLAALYDLMDTYRVRHVPIVDRDGELVGLLTHTDLAMTTIGSLSDMPLSMERDLLQRRRIREVMVTEVETVDPDTRLAEAAQTLFDNKIGCLPVVEGNRLVGILTESDFVRKFVEEQLERTTS
jgi:CBS domain-containing membrane protein